MSRETQFSQETVAYERHARHVAAVFKNTQEEEQQYDNRDEADDGSHASEDAVDHQ